MEISPILSLHNGICSSIPVDFDKQIYYLEI